MPLIKSPKPRSDAPAPEATVDAEPTVDALLAELQSSYPHVRRVAARRLGDYPESADVLWTAVASESQESVREAIFTSLIRIGAKPTAAGLEFLLQSEDVGLRNGAIETLKTMPDAVTELIGEVFAGARDVRIFGVEILSVVEHPASARWLTRVIEEDSDLNVCAAAVDGLAACGGRESKAPLLRLLQRFPNEPFLEFAVQAALARIESMK